MEHILQIGISIDDEAIKKAVIETATKQVAEELRSSVSKSIVEKASYYGNTMKLNLDGERIVREVVAEYKDEIIAGAIKTVSETITRSKKYKEFLARLAEEIGDSDEQ